MVYTRVVPSELNVDRSSNGMHGTGRYEFTPEGTGTKLTFHGQTLLLQAVVVVRQHTIIETRPSQSPSLAPGTRSGRHTSDRPASGASVDLIRFRNGRRGCCAACMPRKGDVARRWDRSSRPPPRCEADTGGRPAALASAACRGRRQSRRRCRGVGSLSIAAAAA
jgi:hypothetical protein